MTGSKLRISQAAAFLGVTAQTLRTWDSSGKLRAQRSAGGQRYYDLIDLQRYATDIIKFGWAWATSAQAPVLPEEYYCERQDRFTSRLTKMSAVFLSAHNESIANTNLVSLLTLVAGEIGDNSFAHNHGNWPDVPGVYFAYDTNKHLIVLADRGRGVRATLQRVRPYLASDVEALHVAFTEIVSGRDPEKRGNGLKVVKRVTEANPIGLQFRSGLGKVELPQGTGPMHITMTDENVRGTFAIIYV